MILKEIEINGFKSFANESILTFENGITAIVGPNGSGKSNIVDAVRWVLGEQKVKQLRGQNMQDVIFSGTENRKSKSFAYVSLTIDNKDRKLALDYDEVKVSRRLYRSGESEYKINDVNCRLKDINEIFYDTGIGKEGYSIIGQGQIDKILSNKPEDRRELFDEAVGIVKFKRRKALAEKQLEEEQFNLARVKDIINELKDRVGPLKKQAESAKAYLNLRDSLIKFESNFFIKQLDFDSQNIKDGTDQLALIKNDLETANNKLSEFNQKYEEIENRVTEIDLNLTNFRNSISEKTALREKINGEINVIKEQINSENIINKTKENQLKNINKNIQDTINQIASSYNLLSDIKDQFDFIKTNDQNNENLDLNSLNDVYHKISDSMKHMQEYVNSLMGDDNYFDFNKNFVEKNRISSNAHSSSFSDLNQERKALDDTEKAIIDKNNILNENSEKLAFQSKEIDELNQKINDQKAEFLSAETKLDSLKNMLERYEGYSDAIKQVMDNADKFNGIQGIVADLIKTEEKYEVAVEVAIGNAIQNIVTDNIDTAKNIINYVKDKQLGRVTILPLQSLAIRDNEKYESLRNATGVIDICSNLVQYEPQYKILVDFILNRCLVVDTFDNARKIFNDSNKKLKIVTLSGEIFLPGGSVSGGSFKNSTNLIGRNREYTTLKSKVNVLKDKLDKLNTDKHRVNEEYDKLSAEINILKDDINALQLEKNTRTLNILSKIKVEYTQISSQAEFTMTDTNRLLNDLKSLFEQRSDLDIDLEQEKSIREKELKIESFNNDIIQLQNDLLNLEKSIKDLTDEKDKLLSNRKEFFDSKDRLSSELLNLKQQETKLQNSIEKSSLSIEEITKKNYEEYGMTYESAKEKYDESVANDKDLKNNISEIKRQISQLGPISIDAIEEYAQVSDRYDKMLTQYDDITESESKILAIVDDLDANMKKEFDEKFKFIKEEFNRVFKELFNGGSASLSLVDAEDGDELNAGVQISVQPPGKRLGSLSQLSGGERAMTAIALLFAIQNLRPSPFCFLDELDAPLDEFNVEQFSNYIKNMVKNTQFILITHRRGTMEKADRLYGVTMQEKGITALVSVNLVEDQLT